MNQETPSNIPPVMSKATGLKKRSVAAVILLPFITFGIYAIYWFVKTKDELNQSGAQIPSAILLIIPIANIFWMWKFCEGVEKTTNKGMSGAMAFVLILLVGGIGAGVIQIELNKHATA